MSTLSAEQSRGDGRGARKGPAPVAGVAALATIFLGTYLLLASPLHRLVPTAGIFVPALIGLGFLLAARVIAVAIGGGDRTTTTIKPRPSVIATLVLTVALCAAVRSKSFFALGSGGGDAPPDARSLPAAFLDAAARALGSHGRLGRAGEIALMVTLEESIKLLPVFLLIRRRAIRSAADAMLAGGLGGLCFGMVEAINHSFFLYAPAGSPATTYLIRVLVMAPSHGVGAAVACGVTFALACGRRTAPRGHPAWRDGAVGFAVAVALHAAHNGLQAIVGPPAQIVTVFLPLALLYALGSWARRVDDSENVSPALSSLSVSPAAP